MKETFNQISQSIGCDVYNQEVTGDVAATLTAASGGANKSGAKVISIGNVAGTLDANYYRGCGERQGVEREVVLDTYQTVTGALTPGAHPGSYNGQDAYNDMFVTEGADESNNTGDISLNSNRGISTDSESTGLQRSSDCDAGGVDNLEHSSTAVRRLTPLECERLQGFPDNWTDIGEWTDSKGKIHKESSDSARYKALGNSIALPFWQYLARRICAQYERDVTMGSLFDGIGGFPYAFERCGAKAVWASEIEEFPIAVTKRHFPEDEE